MRTSQAMQLFALLFVGTLAIASAQNVSQVLANYPQFSTFARLMQETGVVNEVGSRSSVTLLMPENGPLDAYVAAHPSYTTQMVADALRYHCLLQYFGGQELAQLTAEGYIVTTLFQTTGRANGLDGFVNLTKTTDGTVTVGPSTPMTPPQANIVTNITQFPYNYSFIQISGVLEPLGLAAAQLAPTTPPSMAPVPAPASVPAMAPMVPSPASVPAMAPMVPSPASVPSMVPVMPPMMESPASVPAMAPMMESPASVPSMAPVETPVESPVKAPVKAPVEAPVAPVMPPSPPVNGPAANAPMAPPASAGSAVGFNAVGFVASLAVAAFFF